MIRETKSLGSKLIQGFFRDSISFVTERISWLRVCMISPRFSGAFGLKMDAKSSLLDCRQCSKCLFGCQYVVNS